MAKQTVTNLPTNLTPKKINHLFNITNKTMETINLQHHLRSQEIQGETHILSSWG